MPKPYRLTFKSTAEEAQHHADQAAYRAYMRPRQAAAAKAHNDPPAEVSDALYKKLGIPRPSDARPTIRKAE